MKFPKPRVEMHFHYGFATKMLVEMHFQLHKRGLCGVGVGKTDDNFATFKIRRKISPSYNYCTLGTDTRARSKGRSTNLQSSKVNRISSYGFQGLRKHKQLRHKFGVSLRS